jgi:polyisoprenoid-binding protein YceI
MSRFPEFTTKLPETDTTLSERCSIFALSNEIKSNYNKLTIKKMEKTNVKWVIDPAHSEVGFKVKHLMISNVKGAFREFEGTVSTAGEDFSTSAISFSINAASVDTGDKQRDGHLQSPDFFEVEKYGKITFTSDALKKKDEEGNFELTGDLTIKGVSKKVKLNVEYAGLMKDPWGNVKAGFNITGKINRKDWGLNWNAALEAGGVLVSEEVSISCEVQLAKQA